MKALFSLFLISLIIIPLLPLASAHGVCTGIPPRFGRLDDVHFSSQSIQTGDTIIITGNITSMIQQNLQGYLSIHSNPSPHGRWQVMSTEPKEHTVNITQFSRVPFSIAVKALQPGTYKISPMLYLPKIGPAFSMLNGCNTEPVVTVTGNSICSQGFVGIMKAEDDSPACVKPDTAGILVKRGWAISTMKSIHDASNQEMNGTLSGNIILAGGPRSDPQANYEVDVYASDGVTIIGKTLSDANGNYSIQLPAGNYTIYAPDYPIRQTHLVSVISGENTVLNITYGTGYK